MCAGCNKGIEWGQILRNRQTIVKFGDPEKAEAFDDAFLSSVLEVRGQQMRPAMPRKSERLGHLRAGRSR